jgi:hypothetical protein
MELNFRADWSLHDAVIWIADRNEDRLRNRAFRLPTSLTAWKLYPTMDGEGALWAEAADLLLSVLRAGQLSARRIQIEGSATAIEPGWWNERDLRNLEPNDPLIVVSAESVKAEFPGASKKRKSHAEIVQWCRDWIVAGKGTGMDKAWPDFRDDPAHVALSRDDVFRPAWREAKAR